jgi:hypothetical protein
VKPILAGTLLTAVLYLAISFGMLLAGFHVPFAGVPGAIVGIPAGVLLIRYMNARR